jgi:hypothetical protein
LLYSPRELSHSPSETRLKPKLRFLLWLGTAADTASWKA